MRKGGYKLLGLSALASLMLIGGTWAAWTQEIQTGNEFMPGDYRTTLDEIFIPPAEWTPGVTQEKKVWISNKGTVPVLAKVVITQSWIRKEDVFAVQVDAGGNVVEEKIKPYKGEAFPLAFQTESGQMEYAAVPNFNKDNVVLLDAGRAAEDSLSLGLTAVKTMDAARGKWLLMNEEPDDQNRFTLYYMGIIDADGKSPVILDSVTLNEELGTTLTGKETCHVILPDGSKKQVTIDRVNAAYGYDSSKYTMDIMATTVQATVPAVKEVFGKDGDALVFLSNQIAMSGIFEASEAKALCMEERNGTLVYTPYRTAEGKEEGNWFMSFTNMVPGGIYKDKLTIRNDSRKAWHLYLQVLPREQEQIKDELLGHITMKVRYKGRLLYEGKATGASLVTEEGLQRVVPLGVYAPGSHETIDVELMLDANLGLSDKTRAADSGFNGVLAKIDWKFMVTSSGGDGGGGGGGGGGTPDIVAIPDEDIPLSEGSVIEPEEVPLALLPKTGDTAPFIPIAVTVLGSAVILLYLGKKLHGAGKNNKKEIR